MPKKRQRDRGRPSNKAAKGIDVPPNSDAIELPHDVLFYVGGYLWHSSSTLAACSRVCRAWYDAFRPSIFTRVVLKTPELAQSFKRFVLDHPEVVLWVRELCLDAAVAIHPAGSVSLGFRRDRNGDWIYGIPEMFRGIFANVRSLGLRNAWIPSNLDLASEAVKTFLSGLSTFLGVVSLTISVSKVPNYVVKAMVFSLPQLTDLHLHTTSVEGRGDEESQLSALSYTLDRPVKLTSFRIHNSINTYESPEPSSYVLRRWFIGGEDSATHPYWDTLHFSTGRYVESGQMADLIRDCLGVKRAAHIRHLVLCYQPLTDTCAVRPDESVNPRIDIGMFTGLRTLHVDTVGFFNFRTFLQEVTSPDIYRFSLTLSFRFIGELRVQSFIEVDNCLDGPMFINLREVVFDYLGPLSPAKVTQRMKQALPKTALRASFRVVRHKNLHESCSGNN